MMFVAPSRETDFIFMAKFEPFRYDGTIFSLEQRAGNPP